MIRNIILDGGGVTMNVKVLELIKKYRPNPFEMKVMVQVMAGSEEWDNWNKGNYRDVYELVDVLKQKYPKYQKLMEKAFLDDWSFYMKPDEKMWQGIARLKKAGYRIYMLCDVPDELHQIMKTYPGYELIDGGVFSHEEHQRKPDQRMYDTLISRYGLKPEECVMIDDETAYLKPAEAMGMHVIHFRNADDALKQLAQMLKEHNS
ncbi:MAG: HAD-IA family hydrolase [Solobacterium sp.]|nr:HAD family hydrolase [Erysipelotrichaceae bacterium]MBQ9154681.1 HAD-IA family hydrolase [Solobacterium sp.]